MHRTDTIILIKALKILSKDIRSEDGIANAAILEAAERLEELNKDNKTFRQISDSQLQTIDVLKRQLCKCKKK